MRHDTIRQSVVFKDLFGKPVVARFDQPNSSSDGGALLLKACDERLGLTDALARCLPDGRQQSKVEHSFHDLVRQRVFGIACGYEDCNDAARVGDDPIHKLLVGRDPVEGVPLASQSTLSRFENALGPRSLMRMGLALADTVIARHRKRLRGRVKRITVELDPTDDPTHGAQQLSFFNGHYDTWCYLPTAGFIQFDDESEQYLFAYVLRPGNANAKLGAIGILRRVLKRLRRAEGPLAAKEAYDALYQYLEDHNAAAVESLKEAGGQMTALQDLGVPATLHRSLLSTNVIENAILNIRRRMSKVNRWRAKTEMADRYLAAGLLYAESTFRKIVGYTALPKLCEALNETNTNLS